MVATTHVTLALRRESASIDASSLSKAAWLNRVSLDGEPPFIPDKKTNAPSCTRLTSSGSWKQNYEQIFCRNYGADPTAGETALSHLGQSVPHGRLSQNPLYRETKFFLQSTFVPRLSHATREIRPGGGRC